ncbi:MAG: winged helix-turn-helix domain-containing protein [Methylocystis sp.]|uniref:winged helix-turn-helix domain-containing protein n=1 Tax=Methylocystis sp. TaxID=1911079 RepID=UPI003DA5486D
MNGFVWRFAGFEYSPHGGLRKDGVHIPVGPQARQLLELLLESRGAVVSKAEIGERLWPGRPPSDDSIDRCAYLLRKPLREAGFGDLIATAYGRGLSLRARVEVVDPAAEDSRLARSEIDNRVLELWQTAYELAGRLTRDGFARAQEAVQAAGARDDSSPAIWSLSADIAASRVTFGYLRPADAAQMIERDAGRALTLSPDFPAALSVLGWARATLHARPEDGLEMLDRAVAKDPSYGKARAHRSWALARLSRLDEAIEEMETALCAEPHHRWLLSMRAWLAFCAGDIDGSAKRAEDGLAIRPDAAGLHSISALSASLSDRHAEAEGNARRGLSMIPGHPILLAVLAYVLARAGRLEEADATLTAACLDDGVAPPSSFHAGAQLALGRKEEAVATLRQGAADGCPWLAFAPYDPQLEPVRGEIDGLSRGTGAAG